jgi:hypothetical protein
LAGVPFELFPAAEFRLRLLSLLENGFGLISHEMHDPHDSREAVWRIAAAEDLSDTGCSL